MAAIGGALVAFLLARASAILWALWFFAEGMTIEEVTAFTNARQPLFYLAGTVEEVLTATAGGVVTATLSRSRAYRDVLFMILLLYAMRLGYAAFLRAGYGPTTLPVWYQVVRLVLVIPSALLGGAWIRRRGLGRAT